MCISGIIFVFTQLKRFIVKTVKKKNAEINRQEKEKSSRNYSDYIEIDCICYLSEDRRAK